jgi:hypothetical protein
MFAVLIISSMVGYAAGLSIYLGGHGLGTAVGAFYACGLALPALAIMAAQMLNLGEQH